MKRKINLTRILFVVFAAVLSLSLVSNTLAKYTTSDSAGDTARVAKWGVAVNVTGDDAFGLKYNDVIEAEGTKVVSNNGDNVLAPGTNGTLLTASITGKPEVAVNVNVTVDLDLGDKWLVSGSVYCPLVITVNGTPYKIDATNTDTAKLEAAVEAAIRTALGHGDHGANDDTLAKSVTVLWSWAFSTDAATDAKDTALGDLAVAPTVTMSINVAVTQID